MQSTQSLSPHTSAPLTAPLSVEKVQANVQHVQDAKVVIFLVNHKNFEHSQVIRNYLANYSNLSKSLLLVEDPDDVDMWSQFLPTICWENKEILSQIQKTKKIFDNLKSVVNCLTDSKCDCKKKKVAVNQIVINAEASKLTLDDNYLERIFSYLDESERFFTELQKEKEVLRGLLQKIYAIFVDQTIKKTFPARQIALIKSVEDHLTSIPEKETPEKIIVICGASHGDPHCSIIPEETQKFLNFLQSRTTYYIYNL